MRIVIDMQGAQTESRFRGIGRYTLSIAQAVVRHRGEHEVLLALNGSFAESIEIIRAIFDTILPQENILVWEAPTPVRACEPGNDWRREAAEVIREAFLSSLDPDVILVSSLFEGYVDDAVTSIGKFVSDVPTAVILYDLIPLLNASTYLDPNPSYAHYYRAKIESLKRANLWLAISEFAAQEGRVALSLPDESVLAISTACDEIFRPVEIDDVERKASLERFGIDRKFVLYTGGADERKNLSRLIRAYGKMQAELRSKHQLVFAGRMPDGDVLRLQAEASAAGLGSGELLFTGYVSDDQLVKLYNLCTLFVFPSRHEGFGLPALEAMSCGAPVIGANASSIPEVIGNADALFDPLSEEDLCAKLENALTHEQLRRNLALVGLERARKFSWGSCADTVLSVLSARFDGDASKRRRAFTSTADALDSHLAGAIAQIMPQFVADEELQDLALILSRIFFDSKLKQIFIDVSELVQRDARTGVQRVTRSVVMQLLRNPPTGFMVRPVYASTDAVGYRYANCSIADATKLIAEAEDKLIDFRAGDIFLGLDLQHHVVAVQKEYLMDMKRKGAKVFFVVYDLLPIQMPQMFPAGTEQAHINWLETLASFDGAICISRSVAAELAQWHNPRVVPHRRPFQIRWFHLGADVENSVPSVGLPKNSAELLNQFSKSFTFLVVGTVEPRKGYAQILRAFSLLWREGKGVQLVIVGKQGWMVESLIEQINQHPELGRRMFWLQSASDEYLERIYSASTCLIAASEGEGFGLPLIEAAKRKLPIIARDIPVFREVAGEHAFYFAGTYPDALANTIIDWLTLYEAQKHPDSAGMSWLTWEQSAQQLIRAITTGAGDGS
jgi:glycosyltransferase involved in cell wall biosynthesis